MRSGLPAVFVCAFLSAAALAQRLDAGELGAVPSPVALEERENFATIAAKAAGFTRA